MVGGKIVILFVEGFGFNVEDVIIVGNICLYGVIGG